MLKPLLACALVVSMLKIAIVATPAVTLLAAYWLGQIRGGELGMAYAREEAAHYKNAISLRDQQLYDIQIQAIYWKRTTEKLLSGPTTQVFDCLAVDTSN